MVKSWVVALALLTAGSALAQPVSSYQNLQNNQGGDGGASAEGGPSSGNAALYDMIQQLQETVRQLNGKIEEQQHKLQQLQSQSKSRYIDLDQRILDLNKKLAGITSAASASSNPATSGTSAVSASDNASGSGGNGKGGYAPPSAEEQKAYNSIHDLIQAKHYDKAIDQLYQFLSKYPKGDLTVNAYYWLGEVYLAQGQLQQAEQAFTIVSTRYSDHRKAPDALYNLGLIEEKQHKTQDARNTLQQVISTYPSSHAAELAQKELGKLKSNKQ